MEKERSYEIDLFKGEILRLMDHNVNDIFAEIIRATSDFSEFKNILTSLKRSDARNDFRLDGSTSEEVLKSNSVDKKINYVQFNKDVEAKRILKDWNVNVDIRTEIGLLREIRNRLSHYDDVNKYKNIDEVHKDLFTINCFLFNFKFKFPYKYDSFILYHDEIIQKAKDFADKYNEVSKIPLKSNNISIDEYCKELQNEIFNELKIEDIKAKLFIAMGNLGIDIKNGRFNKNERMNIIKYLFNNTGHESSSLKTINLKPETRTGNQKISSRSIDDGEIRRIIRDYNIIVDYRCLTSQITRNFLEERLIPILISSGNREKLMYIRDSLKNYFNINSNKNQNDEIIQFIKSNMEMKVYGYLKSNLNNGNDDEQIMDILYNVYADNPFCFITDNTELIKRIDKITRDGLLILNIEERSFNSNIEKKNPQYKSVKERDKSKANIQKKEVYKPLFKLSKTCIIDSKNLLEVSNIPKSGDKVHTLKDNKVIDLLSFINGGGEGNIYSTNEAGIVAKVYFEKCLTQNRKDKLILMTENQPNIKNVCWPIDIILNESNEFVGYIMLEARGKDMAKTIFKGRCGSFNRIELIECLITIFKLISELHKNNILLGDINGGNILINSPQEIYFVDTDSYQIEQYPCPVGTELFTPPEIFKSENGDFSQFLRSPEDERYALGVLAFMTIIPGATPYPMVEGKFQSMFRFPESGKKAEGKPTYNYIWSYILYSVKQLFWRVFDVNDRTVSAEDWIKGLNNYKKDIGDDEIKNKIFIKTYKDTSGDTFVNDKMCPKCGRPLNITQEEYNRKAATGKDTWCKACIIKNKSINNLTTFMNCKICNRRLCVSKIDYDRNINSIINIPCERCGRSIKVRLRDYEWRKSRGWDILCSNCDSNKGLRDTIICCNECDSKDGVRIKYAVPSLSDIINLIE